MLINRSIPIPYSPLFPFDAYVSLYPSLSFFFVLHDGNDNDDDGGDDDDDDGGDDDDDDDGDVQVKMRKNEHTERERRRRRRGYQTKNDFNVDIFCHTPSFLHSDTRFEMYICVYVRMIVMVECVVF